MRLCDICRREAATRVETVVENGVATQYAFCDACYGRAVSAGLDPISVAKERLARVGSECPSCGYSAEEFKRSYLFGCPDCYRNMSGVADAELRRLRSGAVGEVPAFGRLRDEDREIFKDYATSSRVRLARNVEGLPFPRWLAELAERGSTGERTAEKFASLIRGAVMAAKGVFDAQAYEMGELDELKKKMLVERHVISLPLAESEIGAVIIEKGENSEISIMLNEEDHVREQCVRKGFDLEGAYRRLKRYDDNLRALLPIARSEKWGYLTACPTNVGTGMRASVMAFLPALGALRERDGAFDALKRKYGITVRGYFGEGTASAYDMYQVSNADSALCDEASTVRLVERAVAELCAMEREATSELVATRRTKLYDRLRRSLGVLLSAHTLETDEMFELLGDVRFGIRLKLFDIDTRRIDSILDDCSTTFEILSDGLGEEARGIRRARIVRERLGAK